MFKPKGWAKRLELMTADELRAEQRILRNTTRYAFDREDKLAFIDQRLMIRVVSRDMLRDCYPGEVVWVGA
jgi:hypothetical protein